MEKRFKVVDNKKMVSEGLIKQGIDFDKLEKHIEELDMKTRYKVKKEEGFNFTRFSLFDNKLNIVKECKMIYRVDFETEHEYNLAVQQKLDEFLVTCKKLNEEENMSNKGNYTNESFVNKCEKNIYYGGKDNPYEAIKIIQAHELCFELGNVLKYILRAGKKDETKTIEDLEKARNYIDYKIEHLKKCGH